MSKYAQIDAAILDAIKAGRTTFAEMQTSGLMVILAPVCTVDRYGDSQEWRVLDRRLQALRKAGRITFYKGQWKVVAQRSAVQGKSDDQNH
ncbi:hypothetical protein [Achromobacter aloeverae]